MYNSYIIIYSDNYQQTKDDLSTVPFIADTQFMDNFGMVNSLANKMRQSAYM